MPLHTQFMMLLKTSCKQSLFQQLSGTEGERIWKQTKMRRKTSLCLCLACSLTPAMEERGVGKGREGGGGGSSCRRAVTLILITKATGVQSHNPLLCPMGVCVCVPLQTCITHSATYKVEFPSLPRTLHWLTFISLA